MRKDEKTVTQMYIGRFEEETLYVSPEWTC